VATACVEKCADLTELKRVVSATLTARQRNPFERFGLPPAVPTGSVWDG
jgi:hypothetical protein